MKLESVFEPGKDIPVAYTCSGKNVNPPLKIIGPPPGTKSVALVVDDPDAPMGIWVHWVVYNMPPETLDIPEGVEIGKDIPGSEGITDFGTAGYGGPCPPPGPSHTYRFKVYALDVTTLHFSKVPAKSDIEKAMEGHILAMAELDGEFRRTKG